MALKPSEIKAKMDEVEAIAKPLRDQLAPLEEELEGYRKQQGLVVNAYGVKKRRLRDESSLTRPQFIEFWNSVLGEPDQDQRCVMIDAKMAELRLV